MLPLVNAPSGGFYIFLLNLILVDKWYSIKPSISFKTYFDMTTLEQMTKAEVQVWQIISTTDDAANPLQIHDE